MTNLFGQVEPLGRDLVRQMLRDSVVEVEHIAVSVLTIGGLIPDFTDTLGESLGHRLVRHQSVQHLVTFALRERGASPLREDVAGFANLIHGFGQSVLSEIQIQTLRVLLHEADSTPLEERNLHPVGTDEAEEPHIERNLERAIETVLNSDGQGTLLRASEHRDIGEAEVSLHLSTAIDDFETKVFVSMPRILEQGVNLREQDAVLHRGVAFADHAKNLAVVLANSSEGGDLRSVRQREAFHFDLEINAVQRLDNLEGFGFYCDFIRGYHSTAFCHALRRQDGTNLCGVLCESGVGSSVDVLHLDTRGIAPPVVSPFRIRVYIIATPSGSIASVG